jgi:hypothetical protein
MKRVLIAFAIVCVISIGAIVAGISFASRDIPEPDVADLAVYRPEIPPEANAYTYFVSATNAFYWPTNSAVVTDYIDGDSVDQHEVADVISKNEATFDLIKRAIKCERCITPEVTGFDTLLPYLGPWRNIGRVLAALARHERISGQYAEATGTCISLLKFGNLIQQDAECIINYLVGIAILDIGLAQARDLARDPGMASQELKKLYEALASIGPFAQGLIRAIKVEYKVVANTIDDLGNGSFSMDDLSSLSGSDPPSILKGKRIPGYFFQPNRTKLTFANLYRDMITNAPLYYAEMNLYDVEDVLGLGESKLKLLPRPNAVGKILYAMLIPALDSLLERKCRAECDVAATRILVGIHDYRKDTGVFPEKIQDLVPEFIDAVPADPYDGQQFRYDPQNRIVYSVGKDRKDSGGLSVLLSGSESDSVRRKRWNSEDVVYKIEKEIEQDESTVPSEAAPSASSDVR